MCGPCTGPKYFLLIPCGYLRVAPVDTAFGKWNWRCMFRPQECIEFCNHDRGCKHHEMSTQNIFVGISVQICNQKVCRWNSILVVHEFSQELNSFLVRNIFDVLKSGEELYFHHSREINHDSSPNGCCRPSHKSQGCDWA